MIDGGHLLVAGAIGGASMFAALVMLATQSAIRAALTKSKLRPLLWSLAFAFCVLVGAALARRCEHAIRAMEETP